MSCISVNTTESLCDLLGSSESRSFGWAIQIITLWGSKSNGASFSRVGLTGEVDMISTFH